MFTYWCDNEKEKNGKEEREQRRKELNIYVHTDCILWW